MLPGTRLLVFLPAYLLLTLFTRCAVAADQVLWVESRNIEIPITLVQPEAGSKPWPLVVMAHGHGGSRDEGGGFVRLANMLAEQGIASVRMDFPGCGDSREPWPQNTIGHMLADIASARDFALGQAPLDAARVGLLGYSMGGRLAMLSAASGYTYAALALWAPAASDGNADFLNFFGGARAYANWRKLATDGGSALITTPWGQQQELSLAWFTELENSHPLTALAGFEGPLLVLHGSADEIIPASQSEPLIRLLPQSKRLLVPNATHGLGFYDGDPATANLVLSETAGFFSNALSPR